MAVKFTNLYRALWLPRLLLMGRQAMPPFPAAPLKGGERPAGAKRILFLGDLSDVMHRRQPELSDGMKALFASADLVIANLETPVVARSSTPFLTAIGMSHAMSPEFLAGLLETTGLAPERLILSVANNHIGDQGEKGIAETFATLKKMGIRTVGRAARWEIVAVDDVRIALFAFTAWINGPERVQRAAVNCGKPSSIEAAPPPCDLAVMLAHWGNEFRFRPDETVRGLARRFAEAGCDLVIGTHPHVIQPLERIGKTLVAHSLGDFLGTPLPRTPWPQHLSLAVACDVTRGDRLKAYEAHAYLRNNHGGHERLALLAELSPIHRRDVHGFAARILENGFQEERQGILSVRVMNPRQGV